MAVVLDAPPAQTDEIAMPSLPRLENGDRLTRAEFERRYEAMRDVKKAELVEGVVYVPSPTRSTHAHLHANAIGWLACYCAATPGTSLADNATVRLDADNEVQPDVLVRLSDELSGTSRVSGDDYIEGPPELVVEIAASSASYDLHDKMNVYRRTGVKEYIVWRGHDDAIDWFALNIGAYVPLHEEGGIINSQVFPGLMLDVEAMLAGDLATVLKAQQTALGSDEHKAFVGRLQAQLKQDETSRVRSSAK